MSFTKELKKEINLYLTRLKKFKQYDFENINLLANKWNKELGEYKRNVEEQKSAYERQVANCTLLAEKITKRNYEIDQFICKTRRNIFKKRLPIPNDILQIQNEIDSLQKAINSFDGIKEVDLMDKKDVEATQVIIKKFNEVIEWRNDEIKSINHTPITSLTILLDDEMYYYPYFETLKGIVVNLLDLAEYKNLMAVLSLSIFGLPFATKCSGMFENSSLSVECGLTFNKIIFKNVHLEIHNNEVLFEKINDNDKIVYIEDGICVADEEDERLKNKITFSEQFLNELLKLIDNNIDASLPVLAIVFAKKFTDSDSQSALLSSLENFKVLYEETPEQVMVRDNRYYKEQELKELEYQARREQKLREREAEREEDFRRQQLRIQEENARAEQRRWEEDRRRQNRQREEDRRREQEERRRQQQEANKRVANELKAKMEAQRLCVRCANYGRGCRGGIVGCGNYKAK